MTPERDDARVTTPGRSSETWIPPPDYTEEPIPIGTALAEVVALLGRALYVLRHAGLQAERLALKPEADALWHLLSAWSMRLWPGQVHNAWAVDVGRTQAMADPETVKVFDADPWNWTPGQSPERRRAFVAAAARTCAADLGLLEAIANLFLTTLGYDVSDVEAGIADALRAA